MRRIFTKRFFENGSGEILGFLCVLPFMIFMVALLVSIYCVGADTEELDYFTYQMARQEVVAAYDPEEISFSKFKKQALKNIEKAADERFADTKTIKFEEATIDIVDSNASDPSKKMNKERDWVKGSYVRLTISAKVAAPLDFMSGVRSSSIVMMIESPANDGGDYPWFANM